MRVLVWHVHGGWMDAFVRGAHEYLIPTTPERDAWGLGRGGRDWPESAREIAPELLADEQIDVVVAQRVEELALADTLLRGTVGRDVPVVFVEHNTPKGDVPTSRHPLADRDDVLIAHVTHFNALMWDCGTTRTTVIEHGIHDPGPLYSGELERSAVVVNEPVRRGRVTGTDLLPRLAEAADIDVFGMGTANLDLGPAVVPIGDVPSARLHAELARRRVYAHPMRWTSLGLSLLEAMHIGMPVVALATTDALRAVPPEAGVLSTDVDELVRGIRTFMNEPEAARTAGRSAREHALAHFGLEAFQRRWSEVLEDARASALPRSRPSRERTPA
jgi:hypothetical protein